MQYLGGKARAARYIAPIVIDMLGPNTVWWEPFCGGLSMSTRLAADRPGLVSDYHPALISLYQGYRAGWRPPESVSEDLYQHARTLPDSEPLKAFVGFGCSFGAKYFAGYARDSPGRYYAAATARSLARDIPLLDKCAIWRLDFLAVEPRPLDLVIYADPPYADTTGYKGVPAFDHALFWRRAAQWEACGVPVLVSEYACPVPHTVLWQRAQKVWVSGNADRVEKLFRLTRPG